MRNVSLLSERLSKQYIGILTTGGMSYGGDQGWLDRKKDRGYACGPVAAHDLLTYLKHPSEKTAVPEYKKEIQRDRLLFPIINGFGIDGLRLALGLNIAFMKYGLHYRARWGVFPHNLRKRCEEMLENDIPVIFSVNSLFSFLKNSKKLKLYTKNAAGEYIVSAHAGSHYMTLTGLDNDVMTLSSWGRRYYARWSEYEDLVRHHSIFVFSNICYIRKKRGA